MIIDRNASQISSTMCLAFTIVTFTKDLCKRRRERLSEETNVIIDTSNMSNVIVLTDHATFVSFKQPQI